MGQYRHKYLLNGLLIRCKNTNIFYSWFFTVFYYWSTY